MPAWTELIEQIETEDQARKFEQTVREYTIKKVNDLTEHMRSGIRTDYEAHPEKYIDKKTGKPYTPEKFETRLDNMIVDGEHKDLFDERTLKEFALFSHVLQATAMIEMSFGSDGILSCFTQGKLNEHGKSDMRNFLGRELDNIEAEPGNAAYFEEMKAQAIWSKSPRLNTNSVNVFMQLNDVLGNFLGLWEKGSKEEEEFLQNTVVKISMNHELGVKDKNGADKLTAEFDLECKRMAYELGKRLDGYEAGREADKDHPHVQAFKAGITDMARVQTEALQSGIDLVAAGGSCETAYWGLQTFLPQFNAEMLKAENADSLERALAQYPLDDFFKKGNEIQRLKNDYVNNRKHMSRDEKTAYRIKLDNLKEDMLEVCRDLYEKSLDPTPETLSLFGKADQLTSVEKGFIGKRGLNHMIGELGRELARTPILRKHTDALDAALTKFSTARSGVFKKESDEHIRLRETAEKVRDNLKKLKNGMMETLDGPTPMNSEEKQKLLAETINKLNTLSKNADLYIGHREKNGKAPSTPAGKERLAGAKELKGLTSILQEVLNKEEQIEAKRMAVRVGQKVKDTNLSALVAKEGMEPKAEEKIIQSSGSKRQVKKEKTALKRSGF